MRWEGCEWTGCNIGDGAEIKSGKNGGPPTFLPACKPAGGSRGGEQPGRWSLEGVGGVLGLWGEFLQKTFIKIINFQSLVCCGLAGLPDVPVFSRVERKGISWAKVKVLSFYLFSCLGFLIFVSVLETG